ncbi:lebercilin [Osmerus mordax]|uniref:lebercilin n=1 Tax=Osmerus mordax TaxID=8014 RepID=UPI003510609C
MESDSRPRSVDANRDADPSRQSLRSTGKLSETSFRSHKRDKCRRDQDEKSCASDRARTRTRPPGRDQDRMADGEHRRSSESFYSEDYENVSPSERTLSPYSRTPSPGPRRRVPAKRVSSSPIHKIGVRRVLSRPQRGGLQQQRWGIRSQSKDSAMAPPKDLDLVTKRMLSARLLKINELRNALSELQLRTDELQKENRVLRQLQQRQEKALQRYDDTESEISQLLARHSGETLALRERLRRAQERERAAERRLKEAQEQLQRSQAAVGRLRKLAEQRELGPREELSRRLEQEKANTLENERKIKDLERGVELSSSSYQRQLAAERKKTLSSQEEVRSLQEELERLSNKLKEKERELDTMNIYANRMLKPSPRKDPDNSTRKKAPNRSSTKAVQTEDRKLSLDFPSPPPAISDCNEYSEQAPDDYLSLKELDETDRRPLVTEEKKKKEERDQQRKRSKENEKEELKSDRKENTLDEKARRLREGWEKEEEERKQRNLKEEENRRRGLVQEEVERRGLVQEEVERRNQEALARQEAAEEERRRKEQLLAKLREIDQQNQPPPRLFSDTDESSGAVVRSPPRYSEPRNQNQSIFSFTEPEEVGGLHGGGKPRGGEGEGGILTGMGRRGVRAQPSTDDLAFGSYAPSFGRPAPRGPGFPPPPPKEEKDAHLGGADISFGGSEKEREKEKEEVWGTGRKSSLMQQLFGPPSSSHPLVPPSSSSQMDVLNSTPNSTAGRSKKDGLFLFDPESPRPAAPPPPLLSTLHVAESRPTVRAIPSFDDDIEELTL